ncbi:hypothetical protein BCV69DRAFT_280528 [Microstroma glucosiphilum]|uniref:Exonuclease domain-containing protein n=1 Tax=Pseudomicrostroma glucosiphilum TaxID=1684307 RepID=A0A316UCK0_9BASI|nr:hypothetical protein BCV69DRAFT_280528 [Pseudomicrostroma glucosiphilum]PWN22919.1 hypothetical protein BCV69DRAFT_280528 [Pseudomicrostroma glucosiphilum]
MFRPLGLLNHIPCPAQTEALCGSSRSECPFQHTTAAPRDPAEDQSIPSSSSVLLPASQRLGAASSNVSSSPPAKRLKVNAYQATATSQSSSTGNSKDAGDDGGWTTVSHKKPVLDSPGVTREPVRASSSSAASSEAAFRRPPIVVASAHPRSSQIPLSSRNTSLKTLWTIFNAAYAPLLVSEIPEVQDAGRRLAFQDSLSQEKDIFSKASKTSYRTSIVTAATGIRKRDTAAVALAEKLAQDLGRTAKDIAQLLRESCSEVGTNSEVQGKRAAIEERRKTRLTSAKLRQHHFLCPPADLPSFGYAVEPRDASIEEAWGLGSSAPDAVGEKKDCNRCGKEFIVGGEVGDDGFRQGQDERACHYHWGKKRFERDAGVAGRSKVQFWTCCNRPVESGHLAPSLSVLAGFGGPSAFVEGDETCANGPHVFKEDRVEDLHKREGFVTSRELAEAMIAEADRIAPLEIAAIDCELGYTTAGMSMTRVTVLDESGAIVLDELVKPRAEVLDPNLRFSGVTKEQLEQPGVKSLPEVRREIARFVGPDTIIIGHGLENDLNAMRLLHTTVVDTALLFPHHKGLPFRHGLKLLSSKHLQRSIQDGPATAGHSSVEDSKASLDLVKWKMSTDARSPFSPATLPGSGSVRATSGTVRQNMSPSTPAGHSNTIGSTPPGRVATLASRATSGSPSAGDVGRPDASNQKMPSNPFSRSAHSPPAPADAMSGLFIPRRR